MTFDVSNVLYRQQTRYMLQAYSMAKNKPGENMIGELSGGGSPLGMSAAGWDTVRLLTPLKRV